jgi:hypothetical protein
MLPIVAVLVPMTVQAGLLDSWFAGKDRDQPPYARYDREPPLEFDAGVLSVDAFGHWKLGGHSLTFVDDSLVTHGDRAVRVRSLRMGQEARVAGHRLEDGTLAVTRLQLVQRSHQLTKLGTVDHDLRPVGEAPSGGPR